MSYRVELDYTKAASGTLNPPTGISFVVTGIPELPHAYEENRLVLLPRNPRSLFAYWDLRQDTAPGHQLVLRVYSAETTGSALEQEIPLHREANNWYIHIPDTGGLYFALLGHLIDGKFVPWLTSNRVKAPLSKASAKIDPGWPPLDLLHITDSTVTGFNPGTSWFSNLKA